MSDVSEEHEKEFLETVARSILEWQYVENNLFHIFSSLIRGRDHHLVSAAFHSVISLNARLGMIDAAAQLALAATVLLDEWNRLEKAVRAHMKKRNALVHFQVMGNIPPEADGPVTLRLTPSIFDVRINRKRPEYDLKQIEDFGRSFDKLASELDQFCKRLLASLPSAH